MYRLHTRGYHEDVTWKQLLSLLNYGTFPHLLKCGDLQDAVDEAVACLSTELSVDNERLTARQYRMITCLLGLCSARARIVYDPALADSFAHDMTIVTVEVE